MAPSGNYAVVTSDPQDSPGTSWRIAIDKRTASLVTSGPWPLWATSISDDGGIISGQVFAVESNSIFGERTQAARVVVSAGTVEMLGQPSFGYEMPHPDGGTVKGVQWSEFQSASRDGRVITAQENTRQIRYSRDGKFMSEEDSSTPVHYINGAESWRGTPTITPRYAYSWAPTCLISGNGLTRVNPTPGTTRWLISSDGGVVWPTALPYTGIGSDGIPIGGGRYPTGGKIAAVPVAGGISTHAHPTSMDASGKLTVFWHSSSSSLASVVGVIALHSPHGAVLDVVGGSHWTQGGNLILPEAAIPYRFEWSLK